MVRKLTIEIEQGAPDANYVFPAPVVSVSVDGQRVGLLQRLSFEASAESMVPEAHALFPSLGLFGEGCLDPDEQAINNHIRDSLAKNRQLLAFFPWIEFD